MQTQQTITLFGTVSNSATSRISKNGRKYTAFGVSIISDRNLQAFHYNVVAFGKQGHFAKPLQAGTASSWSSRRNLSQTTSPPSHSSPQPSCDRFVRLHRSPLQRCWRHEAPQTLKPAPCGLALLPAHQGAGEIHTAAHPLSFGGREPVQASRKGSGLDAFEPCCGNDSSTTVTKTVTVTKKKASRSGLAFS